MLSRFLRPMGASFIGLLIVSLVALVQARGGAMYDFGGRAFSEYTVPTPHSRPCAITSGPDRAIWFSENYGKIGRVTMAGAITEYTPPKSAGFEINRMTSGPDGNVWFTQYSTRNGGKLIYRIGRLSATGRFSEFEIPTANNLATDITAGPDGALWFTESLTGKIGRITMSGAVTEITIPTADSIPSGITLGPDGALWFTEAGASKIGRLLTSGSFTEYALPTPKSYPHDIVTGPDGALWFTEVTRRGGAIGRVTVSGVFTEYPIGDKKSVPRHIARGSDGALWFRENLQDATTPSIASKIGRITMGGSQSHYAMPWTYHDCELAAGSDGAMWIAVWGGVKGNDKIGRLSTPPRP